MKKTILLFVFSIAMCSSLFAQENSNKKIAERVNSYIETIESKITLTDEEKKTIVTLKEAHAVAFMEIKEKYEKGSEEQKEKRKENNKEFSKSLNKALGKDRAKEIISAAKKNKGKGKKKKKK
jgi:hypothetical protein